VAKEAELDEREVEYNQQMNEKEIDEDKFRELIGELDLERAMGESVAEGLATTQVTTQDEEIRESKQEESAEEEPVAAEKAVGSSTVGKGKWKAEHIRAKVYAAVDELVHDLPKSTSIYLLTVRPVFHAKYEAEMYHHPAQVTLQEVSDRQGPVLLEGEEL
jgi:hypothetical protein